MSHRMELVGRGQRDQGQGLWDRQMGSCLKAPWLLSLFKWFTTFQNAASSIFIIIVSNLVIILQVVNWSQSHFQTWQTEMQQKYIIYHIKDKSKKSRINYSCLIIGTHFDLINCSACFHLWNNLMTSSTIIITNSTCDKNVLSNAKTQFSQYSNL